MRSRRRAAFLMSDRKLDEVTLAVFGDHDSGDGRTYAEVDGAESDLEEWKTHDLNWTDFSFGDRSKRPAKPK